MNAAGIFRNHVPIPGRWGGLSRRRAALPQKPVPGALPRSWRHPVGGQFAGRM